MRFSVRRAGPGAFGGVQTTPREAESVPADTEVLGVSDDVSGAGDDGCALVESRGGAARQSPTVRKTRLNREAIGAEREDQRERDEKTRQRYDFNLVRETFKCRDVSFELNRVPLTKNSIFITLQVDQLRVVFSFAINEGETLLVSILLALLFEKYSSRAHETAFSLFCCTPLGDGIGLCADVESTGKHWTASRRPRR
jgi:hypothetical protein